MYQFLNLRSRPLHTLILGLIGLTFYVYYRIAYYDVQEYPLLLNISRTAYREVLGTRSNQSMDVHSIIASKNATVDPSVPSLYSSRNTSHPLSVVTTLSTYSGSQTASSASILTSSKGSSEKPHPPGNKTISEFRNVTVAPGEHTARAIYEPGHTVPVAEKCPNSGKDMDLIIIIMSAPTHLEARTAIRQTWGHFGQRSDISVLFMLGATNDPKVEAILSKEERIYNDIIRGKFLDSYSNLTLKTISTLEWVDNYCSKAKFFLKTDDDMFINIPRLQAFVNKHAKDRNVIFGRLAKKWKPIRNKKNKYYVSQAQFKQAAFPDFTTGPAYLMSTDIVRKLYDAALDQTYLKLEDVFMTGIVANKLGIKRVHANEFLNKKIMYNACNVQRGISIHMVKYSEQFDLWKKLLDGKSKWYPVQFDWTGIWEISGSHCGDNEARNLGQGSVPRTWWTSLKLRSRPWHAFKSCQ